MTKKIYKMRYFSQTNADKEVDRYIQVSLIDEDQPYGDSLAHDSTVPLWESDIISYRNDDVYQFLKEWYRVSMIIMNCNATHTNTQTLINLLSN